MNCPICCETIQGADLDFYPCICGFQICAWCVHSIGISGEHNVCPSCRLPYDERLFEKNSEVWVAKRGTRKNLAVPKILTRTPVSKKHVLSTNSPVTLHNTVLIIGWPIDLLDATIMEDESHMGQFGSILNLKRFTISNLSKDGLDRIKPFSQEDGVAWVTFQSVNQAKRCLEYYNRGERARVGDRYIYASPAISWYCPSLTTCRAGIQCPFLHSRYHEPLYMDATGQKIDEESYFQTALMSSGDANMTMKEQRILLEILAGFPITDTSRRLNISRCSPVNVPGVEDLSGGKKVKGNSQRFKTAGSWGVDVIKEDTVDLHPVAPSARKFNGTKGNDVFDSYRDPDFPPPGYDDFPVASESITEGIEKLPLRSQRDNHHINSPILGADSSQVTGSNQRSHKPVDRGFDRGMSRNYDQSNDTANIRYGVRVTAIQGSPVMGSQPFDPNNGFDNNRQRSRELDVMQHMQPNPHYFNRQSDAMANQHGTAHKPYTGTATTGTGTAYTVSDVLAECRYTGGPADVEFFNFDFESTELDKDIEEYIEEPPDSLTLRYLKVLAEILAMENRVWDKMSLSNIDAVSDYISDHNDLYAPFKELIRKWYVYQPFTTLSHSYVYNAAAYLSQVLTQTYLMCDTQNDPWNVLSGQPNSFIARYLKGMVDTPNDRERQFFGLGEYDILILSYELTRSKLPMTNINSSTNWSMEINK